MAEQKRLSPYRRSCKGLFAVVRSLVRFPYEWQIGLRYIRPDKRTTGNGFVSFIAIVSMAGNALGVAALIIVLSVMNGARPHAVDVEGGTAAMTYIFNTLRENYLLDEGDTIALGSPIFTPYIEIPQLRDYRLNVLDIKADVENGRQYSKAELDKLRDPRVKAFFVVNPSNPPSVRIDDQRLQYIARVTTDRLLSKAVMRVGSATGNRYAFDVVGCERRARICDRRAAFINSRVPFGWPDESGSNVVGK